MVRFFEDVRTVMWREWLVLNRRLGRFIFSRMVTPILYMLAFGVGLGRAVQMNGGSYLDFVVPGIIALNSMNISFNSVGSPLNMAKLYHKTLEEYLIAPITTPAFLCGKILAGAVRGMISSLIIVALAFLFGANLALSPIFFALLILNCLVFAALGAVAALLMKSHEDMANFSTYVLVPMSFLCGTFFRADHLPQGVRLIVELLPLTPASHAIRAAAMQTAISEWWLIAQGAYLLLFFGMAHRLMEQIRRE